MSKPSLIKSLKEFKSICTSPNKSALVFILWRTLFLNKKGDICLKNSLNECYNWLCKAQDATPDNGVSAWYDLLRGWEASYPETTGYIIPTLLNYAKVMAQPEARNRALKMADWEIEVQLPSGAVRSGTMSSDVGPAVFNTGQVLFGWVDAFRETGDKRYSDALEKVASWLIKMQDEDGAWRKNLSLKAHSKIQTYNARTAYGLALAGFHFNELKWIKAAEKNCDWVLTQQLNNGWFANNSFTRDDQPLLHTIGYVFEGLLGVGILLDNQKYIISVKKGIDSLIEDYRKTESLKGWYSNQWVGPTWRCLTGEAQIALVLFRLSKYFKENNDYRKIGHKVIKDVAKLQIIDTVFDEIRGGIPGSAPIWGPYIPYCYINWAVKFFMDGIILDLFETDVS